MLDCGAKTKFFLEKIKILLDAGGLKWVKMVRNGKYRLNGVGRCRKAEQHFLSESLLMP